MIRRIYRFASSPLFLVLSWLGFLMSPILGLVRVSVLINPNYHLFRFKGLSTAVTYFQYLLASVVFFATIFWFRQFLHGRISSLHRKIFSSIAAINSLFLIVVQYFLNLEFRNYSNYLYSQYGVTTIQLQVLSFVAALQIMIFLTIRVFRRRQTSQTRRLKFKLGWNYKKTMLPRDFSTPFVILGIIFLLIMSGATLQNMPSLTRESIGGYESKVGVDYKYIKLIADNTDINATIIHPPQGDQWPAIGNQPVVRYFLFPRTLVSGALITTDDFLQKFGHMHFVVIDPGGSREWPLIDRREKKISFDDLHFVGYHDLILVFENDAGKVYRVLF